jgi:uncharacterized Zn finger protein (UPF0148 family)
MVSLRSALQAFSNPVEENLTQDDDPTVCPACEKRFKTAGGMSSHMRTARSCSWYKKGKLKALVMPGQFVDDIISEEVNDPLPEELLRHSGAERDPSSVMKDHEDQLFELLPSPGDLQEEPQAGPSCGFYRTTVETEEEDERVEEEDERARARLRVVDTLHERWKREFGSSQDMQGDVNMSDVSKEEDGSKFSPFASELDWRIARWAIQDGIGHKSFDRLMSIPGVSGKACVYLTLPLSRFN